jgi:hypothetical protein
MKPKTGARTPERGRLAYDPLDAARILWCQHLRSGGLRLANAPSERPLGLAMFALGEGEIVRLRYADEGEYYIMRGEHPHATDELLSAAECVVCGARIDLKCEVELARHRN